MADARAWRTESLWLNPAAALGLKPSSLWRPRMIAKARLAATLALQRPELSRREVCPHCQRATTVHGFAAPDGHWLETHHCAEHGDVAPVRSPILDEK